MRRAWAWVLAPLIVSSTANAQEDPPAGVVGLEVVVLPARGKLSWGASWFTQSLRKNLSEAIGPLVPYKAYRSAARELGLRGRALYRPENIAKVGRKAGAQYVVTTKITRKGWLYTAHTILVNTLTQEIQMDFRSGYYRPRREAADRGYRTARTTVKKLGILVEEGKVPAPVASTADVPEPPLEEPAPPPEETTVATGPEPEPATTPEPAPTTNDEPNVDPEPAFAEGASSPPPPEGTEVTYDAPPTPPEEPSDIFRAGLHLGSGLLRTYRLSSDAVDKSRLSYDLEPFAHMAGAVEFILPGTGLGAFGRFAYSPIQFTVTRTDGEPQTPSGNLLELDFGLSYHLALDGKGHDAVELVPRAGVLISALSVDTHPGDAILSQSSIAPVLDLGLRLPAGRFEILLQGGGGVVVSYEEEPTTSGDPGIGWLIDGRLEARIWISEPVGILLSSSISYFSLGLSGAPERSVPPGEDLTDASLTCLDLRVGLGAAFRL